MTTTRDRQLGDILIDAGVISPLELDEAIQRQRLTGEMLGRVLTNMELCSEQDIVEALAVQLGMERIDLAKLKIKEEVLSKISADIAGFYNIVPIREKDGVLVVATSEPTRLDKLDDLSQILGCQVQFAYSNPQDIQACIKSNYSFESDSIQENLQALIDRVGDTALSMEELGQQQIVGDVDNLVHLAQEPEVIKIVNLVLLDAVHKRASDIHFEIYEDDFRIRLRVDGMLQEVVNPPKTQALALTSRVKIMSNMDIGERRLPQDARIELKIGDSDVDVRVSTLPTLYGECIVMRILDRTAVKVDLNRVGLDDHQLKTIRNIIHKPNGIFLVTGPTGSGKTTTLYACLNELNEPGVKIITTEDPVELQIDQVIQVHVKEDIGLTFAACLRSILRQDPDIVMLGEIRDLETAQIAVEASLTGHIVLSTLHTNSAPESLTRLLDMGIEPFLITSSLSGVLAQRLARVLCRYCRQPFKPDAELMQELAMPKAWRNDPNLVLYRPGKCPACDFKGYKGRVGLFELMTVDEKVCDLILHGAMVHELRLYARQQLGMRTLREEGLIQCARGVTSPEEVLAHTDKFEEDN